MGEKETNGHESQELIQEDKLVIEPPIHPVRNATTGRITKHLALLPGYAVTHTTQIAFDDTGLRDFIQERMDTVLAALKAARFDEVSREYEHVLQQYRMFPDTPTAEDIRHLINDVMKLDIGLKHLHIELTSKIHPTCSITDEAETDFSMVTLAQFEVFMKLLELPGVCLNDKVLKELRDSLTGLEARLQELLLAYIYNRPNGSSPDPGQSRAESLYAWILLKEQDLDAAAFLHQHDPQAESVSFGSIFAEVMTLFKYDDSNRHALYKDYSVPEYPFTQTLNQAFSNGSDDPGLPDSRSRIARKLCYYLAFAQQIRRNMNKRTEDNAQYGPSVTSTDAGGRLIPPPAES